MNCRVYREPTDGPVLKHICDTQESSSGAPIFDEDLRLLAIHVAGGKGEDPNSFNQGILLSKILESSPLLRTTLNTSTSAPVSIAQTGNSDSIVASYQVQQGLVIERTAANNWFLRFPSGGPRVRMRIQRGGSDATLLWNPGNDYLFAVPVATGPIRFREVGNSEWSVVGSKS
jgi:hypothetical protein